MNTEFHTNIKNLPEGKYWTEQGYSQAYPWVEISRTAKTVKLAKVNVAPDPEWKAKMEFYPGGFCGHMANQNEQTWLFKEIDQKHVTTIYATKKGWSRKGVKFRENEAVEFYDYNF